MNLHKKLCIGTALFGMNYGILDNKQVKSSEIKKIISICKNKKINFFDTSNNYGVSQKKISNIGKKTNYISKIFIKSFTEVNSQVNQIFKELKQKNIYAILIHNSKILLSKKGEGIFLELQKLKKEKKINKIGASFYCPVVMNKVLKKFNLDIVQIPVNVLDNRFVKNNLLKKLKRKKIEIHVRSIFLQGLLLENRYPKKIKKFEFIFDKFNMFLKKNNVSALNYCLGYVLKFKEIDKILVGIRNSEDLAEILDFKKNFYKFNRFNKFTIHNKRELNTLINPLKW